jgi:hypothetical protein
MLEMLIALIGRTHPLALHLPIGLFAGLAALEGLAWLQGRRLEKHVRTALVGTLVLASAWSVASGLVLASEPGYGGTTIDRHKVSGIAFGAGTLLLLWACATGRSAAYRSMFVVCTLAMVVSGHLGATITHGEGFLTEPLRAGRVAAGKAGGTRGGEGRVVEAPVTLAGAVRFREQVMPVLEATCVSCHNATKSKGGLALHDVAAIRRGGDTGPAVVPGDVAASELLVRMKLPLEDDDHMPPKNKPQPTAAQVALIEAWILEGAPMDDDAADGASTGTPPTPVSAVTPVPPPSRAIPSVPPAPPEAIVALREALLHVEPLEPGSTLLSISTGGADGLETPRLVSLLGPVTPQVGALDLSRMKLDDEVMRRVAAMRSLTRLNVSHTAFGDEQLAIIAPTTRLETLTAVETRLSPKSADLLGAMSTLREVYAWRTGLTSADVAALTSRGARVDLGEPPSREPLETEPAPTLGGGAPPAAATVTPRAVNALCPVAGKPIDPGVVVVLKGRAIGFCCTKCAGMFLADPAAYEGKIR